MPSLHTEYLKFEMSENKSKRLSCLTLYQLSYDR